ncbi:hypothetical protein F5884DRAFT_875131 [Xylogone sp. PMI_703]|nr:hypothetical protein F5884DRAFT_875131 [Xylogone sp. PMI_703]
MDRFPAYSCASRISRHTNEVACAALFYGQAQATAEGVDRLAALLEVPRELLAAQMMSFPDRPRDPLMYRLYEIMQNYCYPYKAVLNEICGDGIMSGVNFSTCPTSVGRYRITGPSWSGSDLTAGCNRRPQDGSRTAHKATAMQEGWD